MRRVVVTGTGIVCPLGVGVDFVWSRLLAGKSGIVAIDDFDVSDLPSRIAGRAPFGSKADGGFDPDEWLDKREQRRLSRFIMFAMAAADMALADAGWAVDTEEKSLGTGIMVGSGIGGMDEVEHTANKTHEAGSMRRVSPFFIPSILGNLAGGNISIRHNLRGPNSSVATACATATHSIGDAARTIIWGDADVMVAGGTESAISRLAMGGFCAAKALSTGFNDTPAKGSRPWDVDRDGFVMGEGAGIVILEELDHAKKRGANILAEIIGYGMSADAHHITAPPPDGNGAERAMRAALRNAKMKPSQIDYINAHGTSTPVGDEIEVKAIKNLFQDHAKNLAISSTKSSIGHLMGAAGAVEAIFTIQALQTGIAPPTLNLDQPSPGCDLNLIPNTPQERKMQVALSNSFGFGGTNASLIFRQFQ
ncbi:MAG: beta-ketoacyl-ACP synthase II [Pseudomonadota bacterium]